MSNDLDEQLDKTNQSLEEASVPMPAFGDIKNTLAKELDEPSEEESNFSTIIVERFKYLSENESKIIALQAAWRGYQTRKSYIERMDNLQSHEELWTKVLEI